MLKNYSNYNLKGFYLDPFFEQNDASSEFIKKKLNEYEHYSKTNTINLAMVEYLNILLKKRSCFTQLLLIIYTLII